VQGIFDSTTAKFTAMNASFGRQTPEFTLHSFVNDAKEFGGSLHHKVNDKVEVGTTLGWTTGDQQARFGFAVKFAPMKEWIVRAKVNNASQVVVASTHQLNPHVKLTVSGQINVQSYQEGGKFGVGLEFEPCC